MSLIVCGACAWIGNDIDLKFVQPDKSEEFLNNIITKNNLKCPCCPECDNTKLFYKNNHVSEQVVLNRPTMVKGTVVNRPTVIAETFASEDIELDDSIIAELLDQPGETAEQAAMENKDIASTPTRSKPSGRNYTCMDCNSSFKSFEETNRCENCNEAFLKKFVG